jgi:Zn-dependent M28 family amino/carboxypeptidase
MKNGAAMRVTDANERLGIVRAQAGNGYDSTKNLPGVILRNEDYGRIARVLADGTPVTLEFNIVNRTYPEGHTSYNAVAEIAGTDKADEVVMLGGHLDSWHSATGATDNAIGCAIMMEAVRVLQAIGAKPRRTIRVALWGGEEEGLLGSLAYVAKHFGTVEQPIQPAFSKLDAYWNIDTGTGRVRGAGVFGPPEAARIVAQFLEPFEDLGVYGASAGNSRVTSGTDSTSFNHAGLPGIGGSQDPMEYNSFTHHTILDTYERIVADDVKKDAIVTASVVYHLAMRDEMVPRFPADKMPPLPPARGGGSGR